MVQSLGKGWNLHLALRKEICCHLHLGKERAPHLEAGQTLCLQHEAQLVLGRSGAVISSSGKVALTTGFIWIVCNWI